MTENDIMQIRIDNNLVGIIGLKQVMEEMVRQYSGCPDEKIGAEMLKRLSGKNYIPQRAGDFYAKALVREFKKYCGEPVADLPVSGLRVAVLGPGCAQCSRMEADVRETMAEMKLAGELTHITDISEISRYGIMGTPALLINEQVVCVGQTPHRNKIKEWLEKATCTQKREN